MLTAILACMISFLTLSTAQAEINQPMVDLVKSGKVKTAYASWWGFNAEDSTEALQAAINSCARRLIIDNVGSPWIVRPITLVSNQTIVFEPGVEVVAKRGEFKGKGDCLLRASGENDITLIGYGATLRMRRADYDGPDYEKAEWRHALAIRGCSRVKVYGLTLAESGGDGIYLGSGSGGKTNKDIHIKDVKCIRNYRQGISVITAENLLIENAVMCETAGTPPQAGIDFEPNLPTERLVNIIMRNCISRDNMGDGYELYLPTLKATSEPVSMRFENCTSVGNNRSVVISTGNIREDAVNGTIEFVGCEFQAGRKGGVLIENKPVGGCKIRLEDCSVIDPASGYPVVLRARKNATEPIGGIEFSNCLIRDSQDRKPMVFEDNSTAVSLESIFGKVIVERNGTRETVEVTPEWIIEKPSK